MLNEKLTPSINQKEERPHCIIDKSSIFIGLTTLPVGRESEFRDKLKKRFLNHRKKLFRKSDSDSSYKDFFNPQFYFVFSTFDLAVLSLINDFHFPTQGFQSYHPSWPHDSGKYQTDSFYHQVIIGPFPRFSREDNSQALRSARKTFLSEKPLPLIAICQLKFNNELLIGTGTDFLRCVIRSMWLRYVEEYPEEVREKAKLQLIMLESTAWSELTLILFSDSYGQMARFLVPLRSMNLWDLEALHKKSNEPKVDANWNCFIELLRMRIKRDEVIESVLGKFGDLPIFMNSTTTLGFRFELFERNKEAQNIIDIDPADKIYPFSRFLAEPGHLEKAISTVAGKDINQCADNILLCAGRGDFVYSFKEGDTKNQSEYALRSISTRDFIDIVAKKFCGGNSETHIAGINTIISIAPKNGKQLNELIPEKDVKASPLESNLENLVVNIDRISKEIHRPMKRWTLPKVVTLRIINAIALYNDGIQDGFLFLNFLELKSYVENLLDIVTRINEIDGSYSEISNYLNDLIDIFEKAWRNRFHATWRLGEITDFNLEFKGGIQQIATAIDGAYKAISSILGTPGAIAVVTGSPRLSSTWISIHLNYFDIFQPEFFAARASHEAAYHKFRLSLSDKESSSLTATPFKEEFDPDTKKIIEEISGLRRKLPIYEEWFDPVTTPFTSKLISKIFADKCAYKFTFLDDPDLFVCWYRNVFISDPEAWKIEAGIPTPKDETLMDFLVRLLFVLKNEKDVVNTIANYWSKDVLPELGIDIKVIEKFYLVAEKVYENTKLFRKWYETLDRSISDLENKAGFCLAKANEVAEKMESCLKDGVTFPYEIKDRKGDNSSFLFVQSLFHAYLSLIKKESGVGNALLKRDKDGEPISTPSRDSKILFDRRGGTFIFDPGVMSRYLRARCAFVMSLWDMSTKEKFFMPGLKEILEVEGE